MKPKYALATVLGLLLAVPPPQLYGAASDPLVRLETVTGGLSSPVFLTHAGDGSGRLFILEQSGRIRIFKDGRLLSTPFLDIRAQVESGGEKGLLGLAFHPDYRSNGRFFVNYTRGGPLRTVIAEYRASPPGSDVASPSESFLLEFAQPFENHNGGILAFGPDRFLYIGTGDGGSGGDPQNNGQRLDTLLGKVLRIDVDGSAPYAVPADNPFVSRAGARGEIWAFGLRNPWRFAFDRLTGRLFAGDVGQNAREEIDIIERGGNYGWKIMEGLACFSPASGCNQSGLILPIADYGRQEGISVTGGYVYRGQQETTLRGAYLFGDYGSARIWALTEQSAGVWKRTELLRAPGPISSFGEDEQGELYVIDHTGSVRRVVFGSTQVFPVIPNGGGYTTTFTVSNGTSLASQAVLRFFNSDGTPRALSLNGSAAADRFAFTIPPGGSRAFLTPGGAALSTGMASLESTPTAHAAGRFRVNIPDLSPTLAAVPQAPSGSRFSVPLRSTPGSDPAVAFANGGDIAVHVRLLLLDSEGREVESLEPPQLNPLPPKAQVALFVREMGFQTPVPGLASLLILTGASEEVSVTALILEDGLLSTVPVN